MSSQILEYPQPVREPETVQEVIEWAKAHPLRWFVQDFILEEGMHILHGLEESFKTMLMLQLHEALAKGGEFLLWEVKGGLRTGIAELEMKMPVSGSRFRNFWRNDDAPDIYVLPEEARREVLSGKTGLDRIKVISDWASEKKLDFVSIDSLAKLFPPGNDVSRQDFASDIFSQLQLLPTALILAHDRKPPHEAKGAATTGNAEIVGSGRMSQEPDVIHQVIRPDKRAPMIKLECGKMREGLKQGPLELYFDKESFRLYPIHPFLHLLPATGVELIKQAEQRYGWKQRSARKYIATLKDLPGIETEQDGANRPKQFSSTLPPLAIQAALQERADEREAGVHDGIYPPELSAEQEDGLLCTKLPPLQERVQDAERVT